MCASGGFAWRAIDGRMPAALAAMEDGGYARQGFEDGGGRELSSEKFALVRIPADLSFDDLHLEVDAVGDMLEFDWAPLREILKANADLALRCDADISELIFAWYGYLRLGGYRHEVAERYRVNCAAARAFGIGRIVAGPDTAH
jgi:hypothetical protein